MTYFSTEVKISRRTWRREIKEFFTRLLPKPVLVHEAVLDTDA
jgi:hypothetical protein